MTTVGSLVPDELRAAIEQQAAARGITVSALIREQLADDFNCSVSDHEPVVPPFPGWEQLVHLSPIAQRVWRALADRTGDGRPCSSEDLAQVVGRHRGNVDRALRQLREAGYARRIYRQGHVATHPDQEADRLVS